MLKKMEAGRALLLFKEHWYTLVRYAVSILLWINYLCLVLYVSNTTPLLLLAMFGLASFFLPGPTRFNSFTLLALLLFVYLAGCDIFLFHDSTGFGMYRRILFAFLAGIAVFYTQKTPNTFFTLPLGLLTAVFSCAVFFFLRESYFLDGRLTLFMKHPNNLAFLYSIAAISCYVPLLGQLSGATEVRNIQDNACRDILVRAFMLRWWLLLAAFLVCIAGIWFTYSRTAFYATIAVCLILAAGRLVRRYGFGRSLLCFVLTALLCGLALRVAPVSLQGSEAARRMIAVVKAPWEDTTFRSRVPAWESALQAFRKHPFLGNGPDSFAHTHAEYFAMNRDRLLRELGKDIVEHDTIKLPHAHNQYLMLLAENGVIGFAFFLTLLIWPLCVALRKRSQFGLTVPLLLLFLLLGLFESPLSGSRSSAVGITALFMLLGYFSCLGTSCAQQQCD